MSYKWLLMAAIEFTQGTWLPKKKFVENLYNSFAVYNSLSAAIHLYMILQKCNVCTISFLLIACSTMLAAPDLYLDSQPPCYNTREATVTSHFFSTASTHKVIEEACLHRFSLSSGLTLQRKRRPKVKIFVTSSKTQNTYVPT